LHQKLRGLEVEDNGVLSNGKVDTFQWFYYYSNIKIIFEFS